MLPAQDTQGLSRSPKVSQGQLVQRAVVACVKEGMRSNGRSACLLRIFVEQGWRQPLVHATAVTSLLSVNPAYGEPSGVHRFPKHDRGEPIRERCTRHA
jgi:hypothetical protein